jgi:hypothetical protein
MPIGEASTAHAIACLNDRTFFICGDQTPSGRDSGGSSTDDQNVEIRLASQTGKCRARHRGGQTCYRTSNSTMAGPLSRAKA